MKKMGQEGLKKMNRASKICRITKIKPSIQFIRILDNRIKCEAEKYLRNNG